MSFIRFILATSIFATLSVPSFAQSIGVSLPLTSRYKPIAERMEFGAHMAISDLGERGANITMRVVDDGCDPTKAPSVAEQLSGTEIVVGPLCYDTAVAITGSLKTQGYATPVVAFDIRNGNLERARKIDELDLFAIGHTTDAEARAVLDKALTPLNGRPFAILDDGSVHGRSLSDNIRLIGEQQGIKPATLANFRPLQQNQRAVLRRLNRSGIEALVVAGAPEDVLTIIRDMKALDYDWPVIVGEQATLLAFEDDAKELDHPLTMIAPLPPKMVGAEDLLSKLKEQNILPDISLFHGYALVQLASQFAQTDGVPLENQSFETILGPVSFGPDGRAELTPFGIFRWENGQFVAESQG